MGIVVLFSIGRLELHRSRIATKIIYSSSGPALRACSLCPCQKASSQFRARRPVRQCYTRATMSDRDVNTTMAVFLDLENIALGAREAHHLRFDIQKVLERLLLKGHIVVKKAYCDFDRYKEFKRDLHQAAFELIEIPHLRSE